jgi:hypothetical protein
MAAKYLPNLRPILHADLLLKDRLITLEFTTGDLLNADKVKYLYKIEGLTDEWMPAQGNKIKFSSLQPGNYKLFIKASSGDENWGSNVKTPILK